MQNLNCQAFLKCEGSDKCYKKCLLKHLQNNLECLSQTQPKMKCEALKLPFDTGTLRCPTQVDFCFNRKYQAKPKMFDNEKHSSLVSVASKKFLSMNGFLAD